ncbi:MAG TPA: nucleoside-diphosphate sugar epimerase/dehydratase, partial [Spongiibacteraceae bacterium]|nr:nucleoside-diphosphate sugar epimerase/dehydratase [Spongiibacteraceae bacterium]
HSEVPRSTPLIYWAIALFFIGGGRLLVRASYQNMRRWSGKKVAIYGAGASGRQLLHSVFQSGEFAPMVFLDDSHSVQGTVINGIPVYDPRELPQLIADMGITHVLLALPNIDRLQKRHLINYLTKLRVQVKTIPSFSALASGIAKVGDIVDVDVEDLLGRETVPPKPALLSKCIAGKVVLVTGAGGSIGSELCRQILQEKPRELVLLDSSEYNLYSIHRELLDLRDTKKLPVEIVPLLGNVQNGHKMRSVFTHFNVQTVYHAAAYKHVPIVEHNIAEGIENNVFGTLAATHAAAVAGVETFVLISTDKAVRPTNIMGASKRVAELIVQAHAQRFPQTNLCVVRFGNVLGSSGSVVPLFREQINRGGPITVTHPGVQRYFMTIPEAAQLVLQAGAMGGQGDVFVLDMGEPVYIIDLARRMITLMGHVEKDADHPDGDIEIQFIGLRPGEKLVEELLLGNDTVGTGHPKILRAQEEYLQEEALNDSLSTLKQAIDAEDIVTIQTILETIVKGYDAKRNVEDAIWKKRTESGALPGNVYSLFGSEVPTAGAE